METIHNFPFEVDASDFQLLEKLHAAGFRISLNLNPDNGGVLIEREDAYLSWSFISDLDASFEQGDTCDFQESIVSLMAISDAKGAAARLTEYTTQRKLRQARLTPRELPLKRGRFFVLDLMSELLEFSIFETFALAQEKVLKIAERDGVEGPPEDVLDWMSDHANVFWGQLLD